MVAAAAVAAVLLNLMEEETPVDTVAVVDAVAVDKLYQSQFKLVTKYNLKMFPLNLTFNQLPLKWAPDTFH